MADGLSNTWTREHTWVATDELRCDRCGAAQPWRPPYSVRLALAKLTAFAECHRECLHGRPRPATA